MTCPTDNELQAWLKGEEMSQGIDSHLESCETCRNRLASLDEGNQWAEQAFQKIREVNASDRFEKFAREPRSLDSLIRRGILRPSNDEQFPAELGSYKILEFIGKGGMGIVLKAYEQSLNRTIALKLLRPELSDDHELVTRFTREARLAAQLHHPNVIAIYAVSEEDGQHFLAMEFIEGKSLSEKLRLDGLLPADTTRELFRQLMQALQAAHAKNLIHRDVKPSNLLLRTMECNPGEKTFPSLCLADFGLARLTDSQTHITASHSVIGTPNYMSPEQARGERELDARADLYSAGAVLFEMLTGKPPFRADTPTGVLHRVLNEETPDPRTLNPDADPRLADLAMRLLAKQPEDRIQSAQEVLTLLDTQNRIRNLERARKQRRRFAILFLAVVAVSLVWLVVHSLERKPRITNVRNDRENSTVEVRYGDDPTWKIFWTAPSNTIPEAEPRIIEGVNGEQSIAVPRTNTPQGAVLTFLDAQDKEPTDFCFSLDWKWPDCGASDTQNTWTGKDFIEGKILPDSDRTIAQILTSNPCYCSCIALLDPISHESAPPDSYFWHFGHLQKLFLLEDYYAKGHPALLVTASNNKLDGFGDPPPRPYTAAKNENDPVTNEYSVFALMVLDPWRLAGLGPPRNPFTEIEPAYVEAYTWFTLPTNKDSIDDAGNSLLRKLEDFVQYVDLKIHKGQADTNGLPEYSFTLAMEFPLDPAPPGYEDPIEPTRLLYTFDRNLNHIKTGPAISQWPSLAKTKDEGKHWQLLIQHGKNMQTDISSDTPVVER